MSADYTCLACGSPVEIAQAGEVTVCPSCATELIVDPESGQLMLARSMAENDPAEIPNPYDPQEEPYLSEPAAEPEPVEPPRAAEVYDSPEVIEPGAQVPVPPPPGRRTNPWLIGGLIALLVICIGCLCLIAVLALFFPATWDQFTGVLPVVLAFQV